MSGNKMRIDKWLWAVRIYKTRNKAAEACRKGRVIIDGLQVKPSREIKPGDIILIRKLPVIFTYKVKDLLQRRPPAKIAAEYYVDLTSVEELDKLKINETIFVKREKGTGRPTKKERRIMDKLRGV
jgi:ribosome-associated heat shock protein Hsp15